MIKVYRKIWAILDPAERRWFYTLAALMVFVGLSELVGISSVLVLLNALAAPEVLMEQAIVQRVHDGLGFTDQESFQTFIVVAVICVFFSSLSIRALGTYAIIRFSMMRGYSISSRVFLSSLRRPYVWSLTHNSSAIHKTVLSEVDQLVGQVLVPGMQMLSNLIAAGFIIGFLLAIDPAVSLAAAGLLGGGYGAIYWFSRHLLNRLGGARVRLNGARFEIVSQATGGFKEVKLMGLEDSYAGRFRTIAWDMARVRAKIQALTALPRFFLEGLTFAGMVLLVMLLIARNAGNVETLLPTIGAFGFAAMRLLPALQQTFAGIAAIRSSTVVLDNLYAEIVENSATSGQGPAPRPLPPLEDALELRGVGFAYDGADRPAVSQIDMRIPARSSVGLVGGTGAGKTTLVDLILGLLEAQEGQILADGTVLTRDNMRAWQDRVGYVPQSIYLIDDTVAQNIAFGVPTDQIDHAAVEHAARLAALHDFIVTDMPDGYDTLVGERGVRMSGGQRQRLGIARALYTQPSLMVMDEATSALDTLTEQAIMDAMSRVRLETTVIMIAHRLTTVRDCDSIFMLDRGQVTASGTYAELIKGNEVFRRMATGS